MSADELNDIRDETRRVIDSRRVWAGLIFAVEEDALLLSEGASPVNRQTVAHHDAVSVVALREGEDSSQPDGAAEILLVRQYRHPVRAMLWEVPAGLLDVPGEDPVDAARRELAEETDYRAEHWGAGRLLRITGFHHGGVPVLPGHGLEPAARSGPLGAARGGGRIRADLVPPRRRGRRRAGRSCAQPGHGLGGPGPGGGAITDGSVPARAGCQVAPQPQEPVGARTVRTPPLPVCPPFSSAPDGGQVLMVLLA